MFFCASSIVQRPPAHEQCIASFQSAHDIAGRPRRASDREIDRWPPSLALRSRFVGSTLRYDCRRFDVDAGRAFCVRAEASDGSFKLNAQAGLYAAAWITFLSVAAATAPADMGTSTALLKDLINPATWSQVNPVLVAEFNLMGVWPGIFAALLVSEKQGKVKTTPFVVGSFFFGAFALLPGLALRAGQGTAGQSEPEEARGRWAAVFESKITAAVLMVSTIALGVYACLPRGGWAPFWFQDFGRLFNSDPFVHTMTLDFLALSALLPFVLAADMKRRGWLAKAEDWTLLALSAVLPLVGPCVYLLARPAPRDADEGEE